MVVTRNKRILFRNFYIVRKKFLTNNIVSRPLLIENERRSFRPMRHDRYGRINGDCGTRSRYAPATPSTMRRPRRPVVGPAKTGQKVMELCRFYRMNRQCYKQERCLYMHGDFPCRFYHAGKRCNRGEQCRYSHAEIDVNKKQLLLKVKIRFYYGTIILRDKGEILRLVQCSIIIEYILYYIQSLI